MISCSTSTCAHVDREKNPFQDGTPGIFITDTKVKPMSKESRHTSAGMGMLRSLRSYGVQYVFGNFGTDHPAFLEAVAELREDEPEAIPEFVICPHETAAVSAAHGFAAATGSPQAVFVHVDVGTQNMGAMMHNVHRANVPVFIFSGLAPHTYAGDPGSRDRTVHYLQNVFDQAGIVREFCRWNAEYHPPADPDEYVARGLELATSTPPGPVYLTATRESLGADVPTEIGTRTSQGSRPGVAGDDQLSALANMVTDATTPLVITSRLGLHDASESMESLIDFAESAGAGVVEPLAAALNFPRSHDLHLGFDPGEPLEKADLVILADIDVPWVPADVAVPDDATVVQLDADPDKRTYPRWDFPIDTRIAADPAKTLGAVADRLNSATVPQPWSSLRKANRQTWEETIDAERAAGDLTATTVADTLADYIDDTTTIVNESTTNNPSILNVLSLDRPGSYFFSHGSGLGWAPGAGTGVKLARPDETVITLVGDGSYVFSNPTANAWIQGAYDAPSLTIVLNNSGWNAVRSSTVDVHPDGFAATEGIPESQFAPRMDLSHAAEVVDAHTASVTSLDAVESAIADGLDAVDDGTPAVLDIHLEPI